MARIVEILVTQLGVEKADVTPATTLGELGADSLDDVEIIMAFEEEFDLEIPDEHAEKLSPDHNGPTVRSIESYLAGRLELTK